MKLACTVLALSLGAVSIASAQTAPSTAPATDSERIAFLVEQDRRHGEDIARLEAALAAKPKSKEEAFAMCMQATRGQANPMTAESIGEHCDRLLK